MVRVFLAAFGVLLVSACDVDVEPVCRSAESVACTGEGDCAGQQRCSAEGTGFGPCVCGPRPDGGMDAGSDGGVDAGFDAGVLADDAGSDAGFDAATPGDAGFDGGADASVDAGLDGGADAGTDGAVADGGTDAGAPMCAPECVGGEVCVDMGGSFGCTSLDTDPLNCGMVGNACGEGEGCVAGMCECGTTGAACASGQACCGGACIDVTADAANCGGCGVVCSAHAPDCAASACTCAAAGAACTAPTAGALGETCCVGGCVANDDSSCTCGTRCIGLDECVSAPISGGPDYEVCCGDPVTTPTAGCP